VVRGRRYLEPDDAEALESLVVGGLDEKAMQLAFGPRADRGRAGVVTAHTPVTEIRGLVDAWSLVEHVIDVHGPAIGMDEGAGSGRGTPSHSHDMTGPHRNGNFSLRAEAIAAARIAIVQELVAKADRRTSRISQRVDRRRIRGDAGGGLRGHDWGR